MGNGKARLDVEKGHKTVNVVFGRPSKANVRKWKGKRRLNRASAKGKRTTSIVRIWIFVGKDVFLLFFSSLWPLLSLLLKAWGNMIN